MQRAPIPMDPDGRALVASLPALVPPGADPAALVTVVRAEGSGPRGPGARMLVRDGVLLAGTVGGGHLEQQAVREASAQLRDNPDFAAFERSWALGPALAQCCGGRMAVRVEAVGPRRAAALAARLRQAEADGGTLVTGEGGHRLAERPSAPWTVVIFGAGHVARALAAVLQVQPWRVVVLDSRPDWADAACFPASAEVCAAPPVSVLRAWGWLGGARQASEGTAAPVDGAALPLAPARARTFALVMTHDHDLDRNLVWALLRPVVGAEQPAAGQPRALDALRYVGLIGSKTKIATTRRRLTDMGLSAAALDHLVAPIGLCLPDARGTPRPIGGKRPGEIALSVAADLLVRTSP